MKLIVINSNSTGNAYALDSGKEILLLEAGCKMADVKRAIDFRLQDVVGCIVTHEHGDHAKYAGEYAKFGVDIYGPDALEDKKGFPFGRFHPMKVNSTIKIGDFSVVPFHNFHDVEIYGYLLYHKDMGKFMFSTDTYKIGIYAAGIDHYLIEANYCDDILRENVWSGKVDNKQADRIMLAHMSLQYTVKYLLDCCSTMASTITLCHLSERNSDPKQFRDTVAGAFGVPTFIAAKGVVVGLNKETI